MMDHTEIEQVLSDREIVAVQALHEQNLLDLCQGKQPSRVITIAPLQASVPPWGDYDPDQWLASALRVFVEHRDAFADPVNYRPFSFSVNRAGHHFVSAAVGCEVRLDGSGTPSIVPESRRAWDDGSFHLPAPMECALVREALDVAARILAATGGRVPVELPHIPSPLLLAVDLFGEDFLMSLGDSDSLASRQCLEVLTRFGEKLLDLFVQRFPLAPLKGYFTGGWNLMPTGFTCLLGCTTQLISPFTYRQLVSDLDQRLLGAPWRGGCIHLCGRHTQHCAAWSRMPELKALQLNDAACDDLETYYRALREDQFFVVMPSNRMPVEECLRITHGRRLVLAILAQDVIRCG